MRQVGGRRRARPETRKGGGNELELARGGGCVSECRACHGHRIPRITAIASPASRPSHPPAVSACHGHRIPRDSAGTPPFTPSRGGTAARRQACRGFGPEPALRGHGRGWGVGTCGPAALPGARPTAALAARRRVLCAVARAAARRQGPTERLWDQEAPGLEGRRGVPRV